MRLALAMGRPVAELLAGMSSREISEWMQYAADEPIGTERLELLLGQLLTLMANVYRDSKARPQPYTQEDFMPWLRKELDPQSVMEQQLRTVEMLNAAFGGVDLRTNKAS